MYFQVFSGNWLMSSLYFFLNLLWCFVFNVFVIPSVNIYSLDFNMNCEWTDLHLFFFSSKAKGFDELIMTFLQIKLAESINLQDRFSVAQFHESLRSIKQLPTGRYVQCIMGLKPNISNYFQMCLRTSRANQLQY